MPLGFLRSMDAGARWGRSRDWRRLCGQTRTGPDRTGRSQADAAGSLDPFKTKIWRT